MKLIQLGSDLYVNLAKIIAFENTAREDRWGTVIYVEGGVQLLSDWTTHAVASEYYKEHVNASSASHAVAAS